MPYIGRAATNAGSVNYLDDISSGFDGNDVTFTCAVKGTTITPGQENVYIYLDGVFQHPGESYTISGSTITFTEAPVSGVDFTAYVAGEGAYLDDGTVSTAKLDDDAVTASKVDDDGTGFQVGDLGVGGSLTSGDKLTVTGRLRASGGIIGDLTGDVTGDLTGNVTGNLTGNVTGNTSGSAATVTGASQTAITSVGTLTTLTVDNITLNSSDINNSTGNFTFSNGGSEKLRITSDKVMFSADAKVDAGNTRDLGTTGTRWKDLYLQGTANASYVNINGSIGSHRLVVDNGTTSLNRGNSSGDILDVRGLNASQFKVTTSGSTFGNHVTIDGPAHPILKLVGDTSGESTHIQLHRSNGQGFTIYDDTASLRFRADLSGSNPQMLQLKSDQSATFFGNQLLYPNGGWNTANIAFGSATSGFSSNNTGARITVPLHATGGAAHGSFKFYTNSGDSEKYSLLLSEAGNVECQQKLYVVANHSGAFGTELYNASATGHGLKVRGGNSSSQYALYVTNYDQTVALFQVLGNGDTDLKRDFYAGANRVNNPWDASGSTNYGSLFFQKGSSSLGQTFATSTNVSTGGGYANWYSNIINASSTTHRHVQWMNNGSTAGTITWASSNSVAYNTTQSDKTLKKNFADWTENILDSFDKINPQLFHFKIQKDSEEKVKGFIAQEMVDKFPEAYPLVAYGEGDNQTEKYQFNPSGMVVYLMKAVQELSAEIKLLKGN